jgi:hypothetical protein
MKKLFGTFTALLALTGAALFPVAGHADGGRLLRANLTGFEEVPAVSTAARGTFLALIDRHDTEFRFALNYSDLEGNVQQAHIHLGQAGVNGGVSVFLCSNLGNAPAGIPACPAPGPGPEVTGTRTAADVVGPAGQGIAPGEFEELLRAIRHGLTYANVHSSKFPGGEVRGQIRTGHH